MSLHDIILWDYHHKCGPTLKESSGTRLSLPSRKWQNVTPQFFKCGLLTVTSLWGVHYGKRDKRLTLQWRNHRNTPFINHQDWWQQWQSEMVWTSTGSDESDTLRSSSPKPTTEKNTIQIPAEGLQNWILQNTWSIWLKIVQVIKTNRSLRNCCSKGEPRET